MYRYVFLILFFPITNLMSQNKQVLYDFAELPQTLLLNPGAETYFKYHIGVPLLSGISMEIGSSGFTVADLFLDDGVSINDKVSRVLNKINVKDFINMNTQIEILNGGYRYDDKNYFSFGFYHELDGILYYPKDLITLLTEGNSAYLNRSFDASQIRYKLDVLGVLHLGVSRKINEKLTLGARFKLYSSAINVETNNNKGTFTTVEGTNNIYAHLVENVDVDFRSSGIVDNTTDEFIEDANTYLKNTFFGPNLGIGFDFGFTYKLTDQLEFSGSILDFGFINHKKNVKNTVVQGDFTFEGIDFTFDSKTNYWNNLNRDFKTQLPTTQNSNSYLSWRPTKVNAALKYSFGEKRSKYCYDHEYKDFYRNAFGVQLFSIFRPLNPQLALTGFYETAFSKKLHAKVTYTIDDYSLYNIGVGLSMQIGKINFYGMVDNIAQFNDIAAANNISFQLGFNVIFN